MSSVRQVLLPQAEHVHRWPTATFTRLPAFSQTKSAQPSPGTRNYRGRGCSYYQRSRTEGGVSALTGRALHQRHATAALATNCETFSAVDLR